VPPFFSNGFTCESTKAVWNNLVFNTEITYLTGSSLTIFVIGLLFVAWKFWKAERETFQYDSASSLNSEALNFFLALALGLITADKLNYEWLVTLFVFLVFLGWRLNDYKVNLLLWFLGMRQYAISHSNGIEHTLVTRRILNHQAGSAKVVRVSDKLLLEVN
jgi:hypothetical protein